MVSAVVAGQDGHGGGREGFGLLWFGDTISQFGSQVSMLAIPLTAILLLHANPGIVGVLVAWACRPACGVIAGVGAWS